MSRRSRSTTSQRSHQRVSRTVRTTLRRFPLRSLIPIDTCARRADVRADAAALLAP